MALTLTFIPVTILYLCLIVDSSFALANARVVDYPAVYCNDGFCKLSGYSRAELMQRGANCSFMAGELTNRETIRRIDSCLENNEQEQVEILLYKKNSECPFPSLNKLWYFSVLLGLSLSDF